MKKLNELIKEQLKTKILIQSSIWKIKPNWITPLPQGEDFLQIATSIIKNLANKNNFIIYQTYFDQGDVAKAKLYSKNDKKREILLLVKIKIPTNYNKTTKISSMVQYIDNGSKEFWSGLRGKRNTKLFFGNGKVDKALKMSLQDAINYYNKIEQMKY